MSSTEIIFLLFLQTLFGYYVEDFPADLPCVHLFNCEQVLRSSRLSFNFWLCTYYFLLLKYFLPHFSLTYLLSSLQISAQISFHLSFQQDTHIFVSLSSFPHHYFHLTNSLSSKRISAWSQLNLALNCLIT